MSVVTETQAATRSGISLPDSSSLGYQGQLTETISAITGLNDQEESATSSEIIAWGGLGEYWKHEEDGLSQTVSENLTHGRRFYTPFDRKNVIYFTDFKSPRAAAIAIPDRDHVLNSKLINIFEETMSWSLNFGKYVLMEDFLDTDNVTAVVLYPATQSAEALAKIKAELIAMKVKDVVTISAGTESDTLHGQFASTFDVQTGSIGIYHKIPNLEAISVSGQLEYYGEMKGSRGHSGENFHGRISVYGNDGYISEKYLKVNLNSNNIETVKDINQMTDLDAYLEYVKNRGILGYFEFLQIRRLDARSIYELYHDNYQFLLTEEEEKELGFIKSTAGNTEYFQEMLTEEQHNELLDRFKSELHEFNYRASLRYVAQLAKDVQVRTGITFTPEQEELFIKLRLIRESEEHQLGSSIYMQGEVEIEVGQDPEDRKFYKAHELNAALLLQEVLIMTGDGTNLDFFNAHFNEYFVDTDSDDIDPYINKPEVNAIFNQIYKGMMQKKYEQDLEVSLYKNLRERIQKFRLSLVNSFRKNKKALFKIFPA